MRQIIFVIFISLFLSSCSQTNILNYDYTNPVKIEEATEGLELSDIMPDNNSINGTIAVRSIEKYLWEDLDAGVVYSIEDNLISNLIENGYRVVERDPQALENLYRESSSKYQKINPEYENDEDETNESEDGSTDDNQLQAGSAGETVVNISITDNKDNPEDNQTKDDGDQDKNEEELVSTNLSAADYILSYRVLEMGVNYYEIDPKDKKFTHSSPIKHLERSARTRLHCRLTDSKTSEIIAAGLVENEVIDLIEKDDKKLLQEMTYEYYFHTLPNQWELNAGHRSTGYKKGGDKVDNYRKDRRQGRKYIYIAGGVFFLMLLDK